MIVKASRLKMFLLLVLSAMAVFGLDYVITHDPYEIASYSGAAIYFSFYVFSGVTVLAFLALIFSKSVRAVISREGLLVPAVSSKIIPWGDIENLEVEERNHVKYVVFNLKSGVPSNQHVKGFKNLEYGVGKAFGINGYTINIATSNTTIAKFIAAVQEHSQSAVLQERSPERTDTMRHPVQSQNPTPKNRYSTVKLSANVKPQSGFGHANPASKAFGQRPS